MNDHLDPPQANPSIWMIGDPWRDLRSELRAHRQATVITEHGTVHLLDLEAGVTTRVPGVVGNHLAGDFQIRRLLDVVTLTPCGLASACDPPDQSGWSTPLLLVVAGLDDLPTDVTDELIDRLGTIEPGGLPDATGHTAENCGALYCSRPRDTIVPAARG